MENMNKILLILLLTCSCTLTSYTTDPVYEDHSHSTEVYYNGIDVYFGYYSGFYYYYGIPHYYPWWYYYQFIPPYHYHIHTHVHVHCDNGYYVYGHRGNKFNNKGNGNFITEIKRKRTFDKTNTFPRDWKSSNSTKINKHNKTNYNINKINYNRTFNSNNKIKVNNNGSKRPNKTTTTKRSKR